MNLSDPQIIEILQRFDDVLIQNEWFNTAIRWFGWLIIKGLASLVNTFENVLGKITGLTIFFNNPEITKLINNFKPVMFGLLALSFCYIAYQIFLNKKFEKRAIPTNIIIAITVVMLLPSAMLKLNEFTQAGVKAVYGEFNSVANEVIDNNITDIYLYDDINFSKKDIKPKNNILQSQITKIEINETIDKSKTKNEKVFENKVVYEKDGGYDLKRIDGLFKWDNQYYRWKCNFWIIIISLLTTSVTVALTSIKITRLIYELAFNKVFAMIFAFTDIAHGQRLKKTIKNIISIFAVIFCMALMLKIYLIFSSWIETQNLGVVGILVMVGMSIAVIDGPNIVEQIFGIDAGLSSAWKSMAGIYAGTRAASELTKGFTKAGVGLSKFMASTGDKVANGVAGVMGLGSGVKDGIKSNNLENQMKKDKTNAKTKDKSDNANSLENQMKNEGMNLSDGSLGSEKESIKGKETDKSNGSLSEKDIDNNENSLSDNTEDGVDNKETKGLNDILSTSSNNVREPLEERSSNSSIGNLVNSKDTNGVYDINDKAGNLNNSDESIKPMESIDKSKVDGMNSPNNILRDKGINDENKSIESLGEQQANNNSSSIKPGESLVARDNISSINSLDKQSLKDSSTSQPISESINSSIGRGNINQNIESGLSSSSIIKPGESLGVSDNISLINSLDNQNLKDNSMSQPISESISSSIGGGNINQNIESGLSSSSSIKQGESLGSRDSISSKDNVCSTRAVNEMKSTDTKSITNETNNLAQDISSNNANNIIERRTVGEYAKDRFNDSSVGKITTKVKRSYQIGKNTGLKYSQKKIDKEKNK